MHELDTLTDSQLVAQLRKAVVDSVEMVQQAATLAACLAKRHGLEHAMELSGLSSNVFRQLMRVAEGKLIPSLAFRPGLQQVALRLSTDEQERLASNQPFEVATDSGDTLMVLPDSMTPLQRRQVFGYSGIRTVPEQRAWLESERIQTAKSRRPLASVEFNRKRGLIVRGDVTITPSEILGYARELMQ